MDETNKNTKRITIKATELCIGDKILPHYHEVIHVARTNVGISVTLRIPGITPTTKVRHFDAMDSVLVAG